MNDKDCVMVRNQLMNDQRKKDNERQRVCDNN